MSVKVGRNSDNSGWFVAPHYSEPDMLEFDGITAQLIAIIFGLSDPVEIWNDSPPKGSREEGK